MDAPADADATEPTEPLSNPLPQIKPNPVAADATEPNSEPTAANPGEPGPADGGGFEVDPEFPDLSFPEITLEQFERIVVAELDALPDEVVDGLENVVFLVEDRPDEGWMLGVYDGVDLTDRGTYDWGPLPDRIILFREPLLDFCESLQHLRDEIHVTLVHEIAHYYGIDDEQLHELGWG